MTGENLVVALVAPTVSLPAHQPAKFAYIDALRGYAVLLVITCHAGGMLRELPYPLKQLTNSGAHGVQLFFLVSCVTLMMSWRSDERKGIASERGFWVRRLFRIAPMYYLAAFFYFIVEHPPNGFDFWQLIASLGFINAWHPILIPTVPDRWIVVPGGWSIGVEFTFYFLFPLLATRVRSLRRALALCAVSIVIGEAANEIAFPYYAKLYGDVAADNFIYFWFPNQLHIFAFGMVLYYMIDHLANHPERAAAVGLRRGNLALVGSSLAMLIVLPSTRLDHYFIFLRSGYFPQMTATTLVFMVVTLTMAANSRSFLINRFICALGKVSFSAYILHFFVLHKVAPFVLGLSDHWAIGWGAILAFAILWLVSVPLTFFLSLLTYRMIEDPMMAWGRKPVMRRRVLVPVIG
jgi:peptidoglycan/LPS O-acetylase OafA/YrhL